MPRKRDVKFDITAHDKTAAAFATVDKRLKGIGSTARAAGAVLTGGFAAAGVRALANFGREAIRSADSIGKTADKVGQGVEALQQLRFAGELSGVGVSTTDMAMQRFSRRIGEVAQGTGELLGVAEKYGVQLRDSRGQMRANTDILKDFADVVKGAESEQERLRIAFKLFDSEGAALVNLLAKGSGGMSELIDRARELGLVLEERLVRRSEEVNDRLTILERQISINLDTALIQSGQTLIWWNELWANASAGLVVVASKFQDLEDQPTRVLERTRRLLVEQREALERLEDAPFEEMMLGADVTNRKLDDMLRQVMAIDKILMERKPKAVIDIPNRDDPDKIGGSLPPDKLAEANERLAKAHDRYVRGLMLKGKALKDNLTPLTRYNARMAELEELLREGAIGQSDFAIETVKAADKLAREEKAAREAADAIGKSMEDAFRRADDAIGDFITNGEFSLRSFAKLAWDILGDVFGARSRASSGGGGSLTGSLFDSLLGEAIDGFAHGGVHGGGLRIVGERGPELEATGPSRIFSAAQTRDILSGGGGPANVFQIYAPGADAGAVERIRAVLRDEIPGIVEQGGQRGVEMMMGAAHLGGDVALATGRR